MLAALTVPDALPDWAPPASPVAALSAEELEVIEAEAADAEFVLASVSPTEVVVVEQEMEPDETPSPGPRVKLVSLFTGAPLGEPAEEPAKPVVRRLEETLSECFVPEICMDEYLWAAYERTPKIDTNKVVQKVKMTVKRKGKTRTVTKTITKYVLGDFTWKDPAAAQRFGMPLKEYVIGGMDKSFKKKLYYALRAMDEAGHMPGITSAFRDDYRQAIAVGKKAASDSSFHGGSRRGGYGHGMAVDMVSVKGATRMQRFASSVELWKWIDANEKVLGVGRPYLDRDPPHVTPIDGREFVAKRGGATAKTRLASGIAKAAAHRKTAGKVAKPAKAARKLAGRSKLAQHAAARPKTAHKTAQKAAVQANPARQAVAQARPARKPVIEAKPAAKTVVQAKSAPKPVVQRKPAAKPVVQSKPAARPVVQTKPAPSRKVVATPVQSPRAEAKPVKPAKPAKALQVRGPSGGDWSGILARLRQAVGS